VSDDNAYNRNVNKRMQEEVAEFNTPQARYQQVLDRHWEAQRDLEFDARTFEELVEDPIPVSLINEPSPPDNVRVLVQPKARSLHAVLCEALTNTQALLTRMEAGVVVPREHQREIVRLLYVATRHQVTLPIDRPRRREARGGHSVRVVRLL
jgi:hypothetical protein